MNNTEEKYQPTFLERIGIRILKCGEIPEHVAIIMDGNRRWARSHSLSVTEGHAKGADTLEKLLDYAKLLGIKEATVYALSTDNLERSKEEVKGLMEVLSTFLTKYVRKTVQEGKFYMIGNLSLLPQKVRALSAKLTLTSYNMKGLHLNMAICYKSSEEIEHMKNIVKQGVNDGDILLSDIDENVVEKCLYTNKSRPVDLLIRTSGEQRYSDFLLWQASNVLFYISNVMWPDMSFFHIFKAILYYQQNALRVRARNLKVASYFSPDENEVTSDEENALKNERIKKFLEKEEQKLMAEYEKLAESAANYL